MRRRRSGAGFSSEIASELAGLVILRVTGPAAWDLFRHESGGHRWQRIPPNERRGKVHSSTVTVAVFRDVPQQVLRLNLAEVEITTCRGSGPGGQNRNKTDSAVQVKHRPTGLVVRCDNERSQDQNRTMALALLTSRLASKQQSELSQEMIRNRRDQIGSGERSDKIRTVQMQNGQVVNHLNGRRLSVERYLKGDLAAIQ